MAEVGAVGTGKTFTEEEVARHNKK
eukprot:SAG11_NODE_34865_length_269_cov_1.647059_1_plen_24_part_01